ncbi:hypothetical protein GCM10023085_41500 [Actinomadura viridis]|uniref:Uncharacterized protein n=1 Tax=Actinomadura viridis TaxID=58110 RepID=A0A931DTV0_9ACTN|nr:DUF5825 family protein [Actinomadura viridis]MBG6092573.1 hypothetical protein [Actinomadura viridis]
MTAIDGTLDLGGDPAATTRAVALLRDLVPTGERVEWRGRITGPLDLALLHHLPPPADLEDGTDDGTKGGTKGGTEHGREDGQAEKEAAAEQDTWARSYAFGSLYYRMGPGFVQVKDVRDPACPVRSVLTDPAVIEVFTTCLTPARASDLDAPALLDLLRRRLLLPAGDLVVTLPYRLTRWPIPFFAV